MTPDGTRVAAPGSARARSPGRRARLVERLARFFVLRGLRELAGGTLVLREGGRVRHLGHGSGGATPIDARLDVHDPHFWTQVAFGGSIGAAEAFVQRRWTSPDPTAVVRLVARNPSINEGLESGLAATLQRVYRRWHERRENSRRGSRSNIAAHYDLGNDFFSRFLDPTMMYSCAVFEEPSAGLEQAQRRKLDLVCEKLRLRPEHEVVEIGTGWGGFAVHAARTIGCRVVTTTISAEQRAEATRRVRAAGVEDRVTVLEEDYRDLPRELGAGRFDRLVSIEMIEAVGEAYLGRFLEVCDRLLGARGLALVQAIVMSDATYPLYRRRTDFIQRYVFPGSHLPSVRVLRDRLAATDLALVQIDDLTSHYPPTLRAWADALSTHRDELVGAGYGEDLLRLWTFYLAYCEGGFLERTIGDVHLLLARPDAPPATPPATAPVHPDGQPPFVRVGGGTPPLGPNGGGIA